MVQVWCLWVPNLCPLLAFCQFCLSDCTNCALIAHRKEIQLVYAFFNFAGLPALIKWITTDVIITLLELLNKTQGPNLRLSRELEPFLACWDLNLVSLLNCSSIPYLKTKGFAFFFHSINEFSVLLLWQVGPFFVRNVCLESTCIPFSD